MSQKHVEVLIEGVVQGVGFRYYVYQKAQRLRLTGWVRNLPDGRVQVAAEGDEDHLDSLIAELKTGPEFSRVSQIDLTWTEPSGEYASFEVTR